MYSANEYRYDVMKYKRCGRSGILLPRVSLGLWHNFGSVDSFENMKNMIFTSFDNGITHFDLANNYGPVTGSAEENFGKILNDYMKSYRDEMIISTKAGYANWPGPYGDWGSRKYLMASLDKSLIRMNIDYVDIFYHHRPDYDTPLEETMGALIDIVKQGKALYIGLSNYDAARTKAAAKILRENGVPCLINQSRYNMLNRGIEGELLDTLDEEGIGSIAFCPLAQGMLTNKYLKGIPEDSRARREHFLHTKDITPELVNKVLKLEEIAKERNQTMAQMALSWVLRGDKVTSVLIGASRPEQILENIKILDSLEFSQEELQKIDKILNNEI